MDSAENDVVSNNKEESSFEIIDGGKSQCQASQHQHSEQLEKLVQIIPTPSLDLLGENGAEEIFIRLRRKKPVSEEIKTPASNPTLSRKIIKLNKNPEKKIKSKSKSKSKSKLKPNADERMKREIKDLESRLRNLTKFNCRANGHEREESKNEDDECQLCKNGTKSFSVTLIPKLKRLFLILFGLCLCLIFNVYLLMEEMQKQTPAGKPQPQPQPQPKLELELESEFKEDLKETIKKIIQENLKESLKEMCLDSEKKHKDLLLDSKFTSCSDAMEILSAPRSQKQTIYPHGNETSLEVLCDFETDGGGWTIIQKRTSGPYRDFSRNWDNYKNGFGSLDKNFWLGLENIHALTQSRDQELRIELEDFEGEKRWAKYLHFSISDASDFYRLTISGFSGNGGNSLTDNSGMRFSTKDEDNDNLSWKNCAAERGGGWWFDNCGAWGFLNGLYRKKGETVRGWSGIMWTLWKGDFYSLAKTEMKIRKRK